MSWGILAPVPQQATELGVRDYLAQTIQQKVTVPYIAFIAINGQCTANQTNISYFIWHQDKGFKQCPKINIMKKKTFTLRVGEASSGPPSGCESSLCLFL